MKKLEGKLVWLYFNTGTTETPVWDKVACITSQSWSGSTEDIPLASKCDNGAVDALPGDTSWEMSASAYVVLDADLDSGNVSESTLASLWNDRTIGEWKIANGDDTYYRSGEGYISSYNETQNNNEGVTADITIRGIGVLSFTPPV